jgi:subtilase family serine protease
MNALFAPSARVRSEVALYMRARGFNAAGSGTLAMAFTGTVAQAESAFGVSLDRYRSADGTGYRAPSGAIHLPPGLATHVISVDGLSTLALMHPAGVRKVHHDLQPNALTGCTGSNADQTGFPGSFQPQDLAGAGAYNSQTLLDSGNDGTNESVALVEFSNYHGADESTFQTCYGLTVPVTRENVGGGTTSLGGSIEVDLDQEVLASQATGLDHIWTYVAKPSATMASVLDAMLSQRSTTHTRIVSDSWGLCEPLMPLGQQAATNTELQMMAVAGISFFAASGDDGSSDCHRNGINGLAVDDPASQPYATGVGGTNLSLGPRTERVWGDGTPSDGGGGGGVSILFLKPTWQVGAGVIRSGQSSMKACGGKTRWCREVPDISFDADPQTGYVIFDGFWDIVGGTSAAAPLMAAFTADANEFSLANGGHRMGFANPFLYHEFKIDPAMFNDVTSGNNNIFGAPKYPAGVGYDMASGLGSIDVDAMATQLAAYTRGVVHVDGTKLTAAASRNPVTAGHPTVLSGKLVDTTTHTVLGARVVWLEGSVGNSPVLMKLHTGRHGGWSFGISRRQLSQRFIWNVLYLGEQGHRPAISPTHVLKIG